MNDQLETFFNKFKNESLSQEEKGNIKARILEEIERTSMRANASPFKGLVFFMRYSAAAMAVFVLFLGGGLMSAAAEGALPGDFLYSIKKNLNEEVRGWFARSEDERAEWELTLADRRLSEVSLLAKEKRLTEENKSALKKEFNEHTEKVEASFGLTPPETEADISRATFFLSMEAEDAPVSTEGEEQSAGSEAASLEKTFMVEDNKTVSTPISHAASDQLKELQDSLTSIQKSFEDLKSRADVKERLRIFASILRIKEALVEAETLSAGNDSLEELLDRAQSYISSVEELLKELENRKVSQTASTNTASAKNFKKDLKGEFRE
jgi:hypothetical protein